MAICTKCGKILLRQERGNIKSSTDVDGFEHKNCGEAIGPFPANPVVDSPKPVPVPTAMPVVKEPEPEPEEEIEAEDKEDGDSLGVFNYSTE